MADLKVRQLDERVARALKTRAACRSWRRSARRSAHRSPQGELRSADVPRRCVPPQPRSAPLEPIVLGSSGGSAMPTADASHPVVLDASVAVRWVVEELALRIHRRSISSHTRSAAPVRCARGSYPGGGGGQALGIGHGSTAPWLPRSCLTIRVDEDRLRRFEREARLIATAVELTRTVQ